MTIHTPLKLHNIFTTIPNNAQTFHQR